MAKIKLFRAYRPSPEFAAQVASRPYDVLNAAEARIEAAGNPHSFLRVIKPEIDLPEDADPYGMPVYEKGRDNFQQMIADGVMQQDTEPSLYVYQQIMDGHKQVGFMVLEAIDDYFDGTIKLHELTRPDKEEDRKQHVRTGRMHAEPVFFAYPKQKELDKILEEAVKEEPAFDFTAEDGIQHTLWVITDPAFCAAVPQLFAEKVPHTYVADGHHRTAAGALVGKELREANPNHTGEEGYNYFMAVLFPDDQLSIIDYNRVVKDLNGRSPADLLKALEAGFGLEAKGADLYKPSQLHEMSMYLEGQWYALRAKAGTYNDNDPIGVLDVTILSEQVLEPLFNITDLRRDKRIDFVGGIRGLGELSRRVDSGEMAVAFALYPVSMQQLMDIADGGMIMPPKTTWFEPKLRSGIVVHVMD
ncbi:MAG: DUF1015 family protein [Bacteroidota bacterium]